MYQIYATSTAALHAEADYRSVRLAGAARRYSRRTRRAQEVVR